MTLFPTKQYQSGVREPRLSVVQSSENIGHECSQIMSMRKLVVKRVGSHAFSFFEMDGPLEDFDALVLAIRIVLMKWAV